MGLVYVYCIDCAMGRTHCFNYFFNMTTTINHKIRLGLSLTCEEYCFVDYIFQSKKKAFTIKDFYINLGFEEDDIRRIFRQAKDLLEWDGNIIYTNSEWNKYFEKKKKFTPPTLQEVVDYFKEKGYKESAGKKAFEYYNEADWDDSTGKKIKNWKQKMIGVWFKDENKELTKKSNGDSASMPQRPIDI